LNFTLHSVINQSINQSKHISIAPYVASESEAYHFHAPNCEKKGREKMIWEWIKKDGMRRKMKMTCLQSLKYWKSIHHDRQQN